MATKVAKCSKKYQNVKIDPHKVVSSDPNMASKARLLADHRKVLSADFKAAISSLEAELDCIQATVSDHGQKIVPT